MNRFWFGLVFLVAAFVGCDDGFEDYSYSPDDLLAFSADTVVFDTIVSAVRTPFGAFMVRNWHDKALLISSISLANGANFRINVDGRAVAVGGALSNVEILANDSLYVLVVAQPMLNNLDEPREILDHIVFVTNGVTQSVVLQAVAQDAEICTAGMNIATDATLGSAKPYVIYDSLVVQAGATLTIPAGARLYMHDKAEIVVCGTLQLLGTEANPVTIRGDRFDRMVGIPYDRIPGQWGGIWFDSQSYNNVIEHARIRNGSQGLTFANADTILPKLSMRNTILTNFKGMLVSATNCRMEFDRCELSNARDGLLHLNGGKYTVNHCTIANYYFNGRAEYGWGNTKDETVFLRDNTQATFENTIIWGANYTSTSKISFAENAENLHYLFRNCLTEKDPKFRIIMSEDPAKAEFIYDFRLQAGSPALLGGGEYIGCYPAD
ncbi:hypothetical protein SAMD00024442_1_43 [Candidatus Symbiothrix dinenymphae]|nr:hypothetical protein SAMD00024442_1_43 [Candidatus Symbiothrix dinenymphae]